MPGQTRAEELVEDVEFGFKTVKDLEKLKTNYERARSICGPEYKPEGYASVCEALTVLQQQSQP